MRCMFFSIVSHNGKKPLPLYPTMEKNSSVVSHNGGKLLLLYPTTKKPSSVVSQNGGKYLPLWDTTEENLRRCAIQCWRFFWDTVHCTRFCWGVGYNRRKISCIVDTIEQNLFAILRLFSVYPTREKILFCCIPQRRKTFSVVSHSRKKLFRLYPTTEKNLFRCIPQQQKDVKLKWLHETKIFCKMILTHESGSQEDQFDGKKWRQKSRDTIPLR